MRLYFGAILSLSLVACPPAFAQKTASTEQKINALIKPNLSHAAIAMVVLDAKTGKTIYQKNAKQNFYVASNQKLLTASAALKRLGSDFHFQTRLQAKTDTVVNHTLASDLYVVFAGDPTFKAADLLEMFADLKARGIHKIAGNIIIDAHAFSGPDYAPGWTHDSIPWYFSAPINSVILNENQVQLNLAKAKNVQEPITITQPDPDLVIALRASVKAVTEEQAMRDCDLDLQVINNQIHLTGCWPQPQTPTTLRVALDSPKQMAATLIQQDLAKLQMSVSGQIQFGKAPTQAITLVSKNSPPLNAILKEILNKSNNVYTESLTKQLGLTYKGEGSFQAGTFAIQDILQKEMQLDLSGHRINDGSGQSRYNLLSAHTLSQLLYKMRQDPQFQDYYQALSVAGKPGSLELRMADTLGGKVVAKTGTANGTSALSGYLTAKNGKSYIFSILVNQSAAPAAKNKEFEDKVCEVIAQL